MDDQTIFYVLGLSLTALAVIVSFIGLRTESFPPSRGALLGGIAAFVLVVGGAMTYAWLSAEDEQEHRDAEIAAGELASPADANAEMQAAAAEHTAEGEGEAPAQGGAETASAEGAALFDQQGCAGCHALKAAGATGAVGPDLDVSLADADTAFIEQSIVDPQAEIADGFPDGVMPQDFGETLSPEELKALVDYIAESVGAHGS